MKLKALAKKASRLPNLDFDWAGVEQYHDDVFAKKMSCCNESAKEYIDALRKRVADQSKMLHKLTDAYNMLKEIILEADIED